MSDIVLIAHNLRSCHNVGSLLRTAEGLGVSKVYLVGYTPYPLGTGNDHRLPHEAVKIDKQIHKTALDAEKQMCWHELKTDGEVVSLGNGTIEQLVSDDTWALSHRYRQIQAGYKIRDLVNYDYTTRELPELSSDLLLEAGVYSHRLISPSIIMFDSQTVIYNDVVAIYHWKQEKKVGIEIISQTYADMMRQIFEHYWEIAEK